MFKLLVLFACAVAVLAEHLINAHGLNHEYGSHGHAIIPSAVSHQSSIAIHNKPIVTAVAATPVLVKPHLVAAIPAATSHQSRVDIHSKPIVYTKPIVSYATPHLSYGASYVATSPIVSGVYGNGYHGLGGYGLNYGSNIYGYGNNYGYENNYYGSYY